MNPTTGKKVAILQSNYIPWRGYFDLIGAVDEFIFYDEMQFTKNDWRNRNKIKTPQGPVWLSIPVGKDIHRRIMDVTFADTSWCQKHWQTLEANYKRAPYFAEIAAWLAPFYQDPQTTNLSVFNQRLIARIAAYLGLGTRLTSSLDYDLGEGKTERLVNLCRQAGAKTYISGPAAKDYLDVALFDKEGMNVEWFSYAGYADYPQLWGDFIPDVSILDLLFNCGPQAIRFMKCGQAKEGPTT